MAWILPNLSAFDFKSSFAYGLPQDTAYLIWLTIYGISYACIALAVTAAILQFKDIS